jgi:hypothetical protein
MDTLRMPRPACQSLAHVLRRAYRPSRMPGRRDRSGRPARQAGAVVAAAFIALVLLGSAAAVTIRGTDGDDRIVGTPVADTVEGLGGNDRIDGAAGPDFLDGGYGRDTLLGGAGGDRIVAEGDLARDTIGCGLGIDTVSADLADRVDADCETVDRQLSRDPFAGLNGQHETELEPDSFAYGTTIVAVFQVGRYDDAGGAVTNGFSTSKDAGTTWRSGLLPSLTIFSTPAGTYDRSSDPAVGYDAKHGYWLAASLVLSGAGTSVLVSRSRDGIVWGTPIVAVPGAPEGPDKEWVVCDNWAKSRFRGSCYLAYYDLVRDTIAVRSSRDGGATWGQPVVTSAGPVREAIVNGAQPLVRPDGTLIVLYSVFESDQLGVDEIGALRSTDGGATFGVATRVADLVSEDVTGLRAPPFVSAEVAGDGTIWAAWSDCRFRPDCDANDVVLVSSRDGVRWSTPSRVPGPTGPGPLAHVVPGLGVDPSSSGAKTRLGVVFYSLPPSGGCGYATCAEVNVTFVGSSDAGRTWSRPLRLNPQPMPLDWIADGGLGVLLGDYLSTSWVGGRPVPVFSMADPPLFGERRQAIFAATHVAGFPISQ